LTTEALMLYNVPSMSMTVAEIQKKPFTVNYCPEGQIGMPRGRVVSPPLIGDDAARLYLTVLGHELEQRILGRGGSMRDVRMGRIMGEHEVGHDRSAPRITPRPPRFAVQYSIDGGSDVHSGTRRFGTYEYISYAPADMATSLGPLSSSHLPTRLVGRSDQDRLLTSGLGRRVLRVRDRFFDLRTGYTPPDLGDPDLENDYPVGPGDTEAILRDMADSFIEHTRNCDPDDPLAQAISDEIYTDQGLCVLPTPEELLEIYGNKPIAWVGASGDDHNARVLGVSPILQKPEEIQLYALVLDDELAQLHGSPDHPDQQISDARRVMDEVMGDIRMDAAKTPDLPIRTQFHMREGGLIVELAPVAPGKPGIRHSIGDVSYVPPIGRMENVLNTPAVIGGIARLAGDKRTNVSVHPQCPVSIR
jgi:hypothetical protein